MLSNSCKKTSDILFLGTIKKCHFPTVCTYVCFGQCAVGEIPLKVLPLYRPRSLPGGLRIEMYIAQRPPGILNRNWPDMKLELTKSDTVQYTIMYAYLVLERNWWRSSLGQLGGSPPDNIIVDTNFLLSCYKFKYFYARRDVGVIF